MCLLDTADGALMLSLYMQPATNFLPPKRESSSSSSNGDQQVTILEDAGQDLSDPSAAAGNRGDPVAFLYYSIVLTILTVIVAIVIGVLQLLNMIMSVTNATGSFWDGVQTAGDYYDVIGGAICGCFLVFGLLSVLLYKPWRRWVGQTKAADEEGHGVRSEEGQETSRSFDHTVDMTSRFFDHTVDDADAIVVAGDSRSGHTVMDPSVKNDSAEVAVRAI
jgi:high-affinity nickel-transport protein